MNRNTSISIIVPTMGRSTLPRTLSSIADQMSTDDEILLVTDGICSGIGDLIGNSPVKLIVGDRTGFYGHSQRNLALDLARSTHLAFMDDDDFYLPGALSRMRLAASNNPGMPLMFRMRHGQNLLWQNPELQRGNVSTQMIVLPNETSKISRWKTRPELELTGDLRSGDYVFIKETCDFWPEGSVQWIPEVIAELQRHSFGLKDVDTVLVKDLQ